MQRRRPWAEGRRCAAAVLAAPARGSDTGRARLPALGFPRQRNGAGRLAGAGGVLLRSRRGARRLREADKKHLLPSRGRACFTRSLLPGRWRRRRLVPGDRSASDGGGVDSAYPDALTLQGFAGAVFSLTYFCLPFSLPHPSLPLLLPSLPSAPRCVQGREGRAGRSGAGRRDGACGV